MAGSGRGVWSTSGGPSAREPWGVTMRTILTAALVLGLCGLASARDTKADPAGTWKCSYEINDMKRTATLTINKDGDKLSGKMVWQDKKESKLEDVKYKDGELTFSAEREVMDNKFNIKYKLKVEGDTLKGKGEVDIGGDTRSFDIEGKREKKAK
jgi:hypothetical protein